MVDVKFIARLKNISRELKNMTSVSSSLKVDSELQEFIIEHLEDALASIKDLTEDLEDENRI